MHTPTGWRAAERMSGDLGNIVSGFGITDMLNDLRWVAEGCREGVIESLRQEASCGLIVELSRFF